LLLNESEQHFLEQGAVEQLLRIGTHGPLCVNDELRPFLYESFFHGMFLYKGSLLFGRAIKKPAILKPELSAGHPLRAALLNKSAEYANRFDLKRSLIQR
jgi:hypothetical protein